MDSILKKFLIMDNLAKAMELLDTRVQGMVQHSTSTIFLTQLYTLLYQGFCIIKVFAFSKIKQKRMYAILF